MTRKFVMHIPPEIATALYRRHHGREDITKEEAVQRVAEMTMWYTKWQAAKKKLESIDRYWDEANIEGHFGEPIFYGAHRRLRNARKALRDAHASMFYILVGTDGNYEPFSEFSSLDAESIYDDFMRKYVPKI